MDADTAAPRLLRRWAWACLLLLVLVTGLSAFLRHSAEGLGCQPWPACHAMGAAPTGAAQMVARAAHRVAATAVLLLAIGGLFLALRARRRREAALYALLLLLAVLLAWLGIHTAGSRVPAVALGNLLGGFLMLATAARLIGPTAGRGLGAAAAGVALLLVLQIGSGVLVSASHAGLACEDLRSCAEQARAAGWPWQALKPWVGAGLLPGDGALLQWLHRAGAWGAALGTLALGALALRRGRRADGLLMLGLLASQWVLGLVVGSAGLPLVAVLLHNLGSALLLALVVRSI